MRWTEKGYDLIHRKRVPTTFGKPKLTPRGRLISSAISL